jgi:transcriptional regulator with XRE-family HTH domain
MPASTAAKPEWANRLRRLREHLGLSQSQVAERLGVSQVSVSRWEAGKDEPTGPAYIAIARLAGPQDCWYFWERVGLTQTDVMRVVPDLEQRIHSRAPIEMNLLPAKGSTSRPAGLKAVPDVVGVPLLHDAAAAGSARLIEQANVDMTLALPRSWFVHPESIVAIKVEGESMSPVLESGYIAMVDTADQDPKRLLGEMVAARDPDGAVTIKWLREVEGRLMLVAQHTSLRFQPIFLHPGWGIVGKVIRWIGLPK